MIMNPFTPNFGEIPLHLAGRSQEISDVQYVLDGAISAPARTSVFMGARGSGKTALLSYLSREAEAKGWLSVNVSCVEGMREEIIQQTTIKLDNIFPINSGKHISGITVRQLFGVEWDEDTEFRPTWRTRITKLLDALQEHNLGLLITVDEIDPDLEEMILLASDYQLLVRENRKIALLMAGLPVMASSLLNNKKTTFLRRASQYTLDAVSDVEIERAFTKTIEDSGKAIDDKSVKEAVRAIEGFPYMMQLIGFRAWQLSGESDAINRKDVSDGIRLAQEDFEKRVLVNTVANLSEVDILFLKAMLDDAGDSNISDIESRMAKSKNYVSRYRSRLIEFGVIEPAGRGKIRIAIPGLKKYLARNS